MVTGRIFLDGNEPITGCGVKPDAALPPDTADQQVIEAALRLLQ